jgi:hypothetical protein
MVTETGGHVTARVSSPIWRRPPRAGQLRTLGAGQQGRLDVGAAAGADHHDAGAGWKR